MTLKPQRSQKALQTQPGSLRNSSKEKLIQVVTSLQKLTAGFPRSNFSQDNVAAYANELLDVDIDVLDLAITSAIRNEDVCPPVSKLLRICWSVQAEKKMEPREEVVMLPEARISDEERKANLDKIQKILSIAAEKAEMTKFQD